ncbi:MAG: ATP-binding protein, partial [Okeania sp. SIO3C4]|nr:ATP-binding protein [Okeania sp. SIO3C4]
TRHAPTYFMLKFVGPDNVLYHYEFEYNQNEVIYESLDFFPRGYRANIFKREKGNQIKLGNNFIDRKVDKKIISNQLFLSKAGNSGHEQMGDIYLYFRTMMLWSIPAKSQLKYLMEKMQKLYVEEKDGEFKRKLNKLMKVADTKIEGVSVSRRDFTADEYGYLEDDREFQRFKTVALHKVYENGKEIGTEPIDIKEESVGTQVLFALGGMILDKLEKGGVLVIDELDNSLHPHLSRFLVDLFHNETSNPHNAQLIFATHEASLLESHLFRNDQVCMVQKSDEGASEVFSSADFPEIPNGAQLYNYYMRGQLGGNPNIKEVEFIYGD